MLWQEGNKSWAYFCCFYTWQGYDKLSTELRIKIHPDEYLTLKYNIKKL